MRNTDEKQCRCDSSLHCVLWVILWCWASAWKTLKHWMFITITMMFWTSLTPYSCQQSQNICEDIVWSRHQHKMVRFKDSRSSCWFRSLKSWLRNHNIFCLNLAWTFVACHRLSLLTLFPFTSVTICQICLNTVLTCEGMGGRNPQSFYVKNASWS